MSDNYTVRRMAELSEPIDKQIMMCDSSDEVLMLACVLLQRVKHMMDTQIGKDGRKQIFKDANLK
jgi:hypothetical protein